ncbi:MAG: hypothetical protein RIS76_700 [Verrucomicrobiota bacterium]|jgi:uncharacterized delta-60 repeat protein
MKLPFPLPTLLFVSLLLGMVTSNVRSLAAPGELDLDFDPGSGVSGPVSAFVVQPDGRMIIAGSFNTVRGLARKDLARLNADGSGDSRFTAPVPNYPIHSLALQPDGKLLVGSEFDNLGLTRLNTDGSPDTNFNATALAAIASTEPFYPFQIKAMVVQPDGKVVFGAELPLRLHGDGSLDTNFVSAVYGRASAIAVQPDGKLIVGGIFYDPETGADRHGLVRLLANGAIDSGFNRTAGQDSLINSIKLQPDGKILFAGGFTRVNGTDTLVIRLNPDGSLDPTFAVGSGNIPALSTVHALGLQSDGKVIVGGRFQSVNALVRSNLARLNPDGSPDVSFPNGGSGGIRPWTPHSVQALEVTSDGTLWMGGHFTMGHEMNWSSAARFLADGSVDATFQPGRGVSANNSTLVVQPDGDLLLGGALTFINGTNLYASLRLNPDGSPDDTFIPASRFKPDLLEWPMSDCPEGPFFCQPNPVPVSVAVQPDGKVLMGGNNSVEVTGDSLYVQMTTAFLRRFHADGSLDAGFLPLSFQPPNWEFWYSSDFVSALRLQPDGKILVAGKYASISGTPRHGLARLHPNGTVDPGFTPTTGPYAAIDSIALQPDGKVLLCGELGIIAGTFRRGIARLNPDGSLDDTFQAVVGTNGGIRSLVLQPDGKVVIGGSFRVTQGANLNGVVRLNADGSLDEGFVPATVAGFNAVESVQVHLQADGRVLLNGSFLTVNGVLRPSVARLEGDFPFLSFRSTPAGTSAVVTWPVTELRFELQEAADLSLPNPWSPVQQTAIEESGRMSVTLPTSANSRFFRLKSP